MISGLSLFKRLNNGIFYFTDYKLGNKRIDRYAIQGPLHQATLTCRNQYRLDAKIVQGVVEFNRGGPFSTGTIGT
jgi:hypothetical protein